MVGIPVVENYLMAAPAASQRDSSLSTTRLSCLRLLASVAFIAATTSQPAPAASVANPSANSSAQSDARVREAYGKLPISFEANAGQSDSQVRFLSRNAGFNLFLTPAEAVISLKAASARKHTAGGIGSLAGDGKSESSDGAVVRLSFDGANKNPTLQALDKQANTSNYLIGNDASQWRAGVSNFARVQYTDIYAGIDLVYYGNQSQLEYDLLVAPGADPRQIALSIDGARTLKLDALGNLLIATSQGDIVQHRPIAFQQIDGRRRAVDASYAMLGNGRVGFNLGAYDKSAQLVIDPVLVYSTFLGGNLGDRAADIAVDGSKNAYVVGFSDSYSGFPTKNAYQSINKRANDIFVAKFGPTGTLLYSTFIGGTGADEGASIAIDTSGNAYLTGLTSSVDFPTASAYQTVLGGVQDAFVTKLNASGGGLIYSSYLGGSSNTTFAGATGDYGYGIAVDASGSAYVAGWTAATNFPVVSAYQSTRAATPSGCNASADANKCARSDAFVAKFNASGNQLVYSTYLGGTEYDEAYALAIDSGGNAYVTGTTTSSNFPTASAKQAVSSGNGDGFVTKLGPAGNALSYSTYLGGVGQDLGYGLAVDASGNAYVVGVTASANFPSVTPAQSFNAGLGGSGTDGFLTKVAPAGNAWVFSTFIGGSGSEAANGVAIDDAGNAYVSGQTTSTVGMPVGNAIQASNAGFSDGFLVKVSGSGSAFVYGTYLGGNGDDFATEVAVDAGGDAYIVGFTASANFPVLAAAQGAKGGYEDAFITRISSANDPTISVNDVSIAEGNSGTSVATFTVSLSKVLTNAVGFSIGTSDGTTTAGNDYVVTSLTGQSIPAGTTSKTFTVTINGDTTVEPDEFFYLNLNAVNGALIGDGQGKGTIVNDDAVAPLSLSVADISVTEGNSGTTAAIFTVTLSSTSTSAVTFNIATADGSAVAGSDYIANSATNLSIAAGTTTKTFTVLVNGDTVTEPDETFAVNLSNPVGASIADGTAIGNIINDDTAPLPTLSVNDVSVTEGNTGTSTATFTVTLSAVAQTDVVFNIFTSNNTAASGSDYVALSLTGQVIPKGMSNKTFSVTINGDTTVEPNETFNLNVSSVSGASIADGQGVGTILNDDSAVLPAISINNVTVTEGNAGTSTATFTVQLNAIPASTVSFDIATANSSAVAGSDYIALALTGQTIAAGQTSKNFAVTINGDTTVEADETFTVNVTNPGGATISDGQGVGTILNDDTVAGTPPQISVSDVSTSEGNAGNNLMTFTVSLSAAATAPVTFDVWTSNGTAAAGSDYTELNLAGQSIPAGQTSTTFSVSINGETAVEANETLTLNLNNVSGASVIDGQGLGTITNDDFATLTVNSASVVEGNSGYSTTTFLVTLSTPMPSPVTFNISTSNGTADQNSDYEARTVNGALIDAGRTRFVFEVKIFGDTTVETNETFDVSITAVSGAGITASSGVGTITNDDSAAKSIAEIQGIAQLSPLEGKVVSTTGVVTAVDADGFYLQSPDSEQDGNVLSAEGLYVAGKSDTTLAVGDRVEVAGRVIEAVVGDEANQLTQTQIASNKVTVLANAQALPRAIELDAAVIGSDPSITSLERFEGMRVAVPKLTVVGPTGGRIDEASNRVRGDGKFYGVLRGVARPFLEAGLNALDRASAAGVSPQVFDTNPERLLIDSLGQRGASALSADAGDNVRGLVGVLGYGQGAYRLLPDPSANVEVASGAAPKAVSAASLNQATVASFNLRRFLDDSRAGNEPVLGATAYATRLAKTANVICAFAGTPDILGLAEVENRNVLGDIAAAVNAKDGNLLFPGSCAGKALYLATTPAAATGKLGFLVNTAQVRPGVARVEVLSITQSGAASKFRQRNGSSESLHVQAPLVMEARINAADGRSTTVTVVSAQLSALDGNLSAAGKNGWTTRGTYLRARRAAQAAYIASLVQSLQSARPDAKLVLLGDFEAAQFNDGRNDLMGIVSGRTAPRAQVLGYVASPVTHTLTNLTTRLPAAQRYTVIRQGNAQAVDHILVNNALLRTSPAARAEVARINADFGEDNFSDAGVPMRVSDHDPVVMYFDIK